jgi:hypothetical protein
MKKLNTYKNKYKNERVFIVGNGPSINKIPLDKLKNEYSFAMNRISMLYESTDWRPSFFICTTTNIKDENWFKDIMKTIDSGVITFAWDKLRSYIGDKDNVYYLRCTNGREVTSKANNSWWSDDITKRVTKFGTSLIVALQIAAYMGFNPIYLIGCDLGYKSPSFKDRILMRLGLKGVIRDNNHFDPKYNTPGLPGDKLNVNMMAAHELAKNNTLKKGIKIINATIGGNLEIYPRVEFASLFK